MNYKKYLLFLLFIMIIGCNKIYAIEGLSTCQDESYCYYKSSEDNAFLCYKPESESVRISYTTSPNGNFDPLINRTKTKKDSETGITATIVGMTECPQYLVYRYKDGFWFFNSEGIWGFNDATTANQFVSASNDINNMTAYLATKTTKSNYEKQLVEMFAGGIGKTEIDGEDVEVDCNAIFGSKDDPNSIRYLIDKILQYPRIIVPILVIIFGILDFAKAVIAGKEDDMKKAQKTFIKRLVIGVAFFFIPIFVDIIMDLADIVWEGLGYTSCDI